MLKCTNEANYGDKEEEDATGDDSTHDGKRFDRSHCFSNCSKGNQNKANHLQRVTSKVVCKNIFGENLCSKGVI